MEDDIRVLFFDHGGVLTPGGEKGTNEKAAAQAMGLPVIDVPDLSEALKCGKINNEQFVNEINYRYPLAPHKLTGDVWRSIYDAMTYDSEAYRFAYYCKSLGHKIGILTNINFTVYSLLNTGGMYDGFHPVIASCDIKAAKPHTRVYEVAESFFPHYHPGQFVMIDDQQKCVDGATRSGWKGVLATSTEQMIRDVSQLLGIK